MTGVSDQVRPAYRAVLGHLIEHGRAPHYVELAHGLGIDLESARSLLRETAEAGPVAGCWLAHDSDLVESWAPFSNVPTHYAISVDGVPGWYGQ